MEGHQLKEARKLRLGEKTEILGQTEECLLRE